MSRSEPPPGHFERLGGVFRASPVNADGRTSLEVRRGGARLERVFDRDSHHAAGAVHGSCLFKLLDDAAFFAANSLVADRFVLTVSFETHFMRPLTGGAVVAEGRVVRATRRIIWSESELRDGDGRLLATGIGTFLESNVELTPEIGYA